MWNHPARKRCCAYAESGRELAGKRIELGARALEDGRLPDSLGGIKCKIWESGGSRLRISSANFSGKSGESVLRIKKSTVLTNIRSKLEKSAFFFVRKKPFLSRIETVKSPGGKPRRVRERSLGACMGGHWEDLNARMRGDKGLCKSAYKKGGSWIYEKMLATGAVVPHGALGVRLQRQPEVD